MDNDSFGHINNAQYYSYFDTAVTGWLHGHGLIGLTEGPMWMVAETGCRFISEAGFPDNLTVGLRVARIGASSVRYALAVFRNEAETASAEGHFIHVHVDRATRRPAPVPDAVRQQLSTIG